MTQDGFLEFLIQKEKKNQMRPEVQEVVPYYENDGSIYPERVRIVFRNGKTKIFDLHAEMPAPVIMENIRIIRRMEVGYGNNTESEYRPRRNRR